MRILKQNVKLVLNPDKRLFHSYKLSIKIPDFFRCVNCVKDDSSVPRKIRKSRNFLSVNIRQIVLNTVNVDSQNMVETPLT